MAFVGAGIRIGRMLSARAALRNISRRSRGRFLRRAVGGARVGGVVAGEFSEEAAEQLTQGLSEEACGEAEAILTGEPTNEGQMALCEPLIDEVWNQQNDIAYGAWSPIDTDHPEAIGVIVEAVNMLCEEAAFVCNDIWAVTGEGGEAEA